ncbi:MAG TPA: [Fe-Fe] hydrogenase large subunit C-terminal domain-containing protein, partial [Bacteroidales bacterium]|nr:[Fe-Fe] hydrogenase large subunit C-terminal domain-containing protein [Bacteroidales bacterium]
ADEPFNIRSSASKLVSISGGVTEAVARTLNYFLTDKELNPIQISKLRGIKNKKEIVLKMGKKNVNFVAVSGLKNANKIVAEIRKGKCKADFMEIMVCPGGCINGGGQPFCNDEKVQKTLIKTIYNIDDKEAIKVAHKNSAVLKLYNDYLKEPLSQLSYKDLHTRYKKREVLL